MGKLLIGTWTENVIKCKYSVILIDFCVIRQQVIFDQKTRVSHDFARSSHIVVITDLKISFHLCNFFSFHRYHFFYLMTVLRTFKKKSRQPGILNSTYSIEKCFSVSLRATYVRGFNIKKEAIWTEIKFSSIFTKLKKSLKFAFEKFMFHVTFLYFLRNTNVFPTRISLSWILEKVHYRFQGFQCSTSNFQFPVFFFFNLSSSKDILHQELFKFFIYLISKNINIAC